MTQVLYYNNTSAPDIRKTRQENVRKQRKFTTYTKTKEQVKREERLSRKKAIKMLIFALTVLMACSVMLYAHVKRDETERALDKVNSQVEIAQSENTRLKMVIENDISLDKVETYAVEVLGMVKTEGYQIEYIKENKGDVITVSGNREKISEKLKKIVFELYGKDKGKIEKSTKSK